MPAAVNYGEDGNAGWQHDEVDHVWESPEGSLADVVEGDRKHLGRSFDRRKDHADRTEMLEPQANSSLLIPLETSSAAQFLPPGAGTTNYSRAASL